MGKVVRERLLQALDSPLPLVVVEAVPGGGKRTLLTQWRDSPAVEQRIVVHLSTPEQVQQVSQRFGRPSRGDRPGPGQVTSCPPGPTPLAIGLTIADELSSDGLEQILGLPLANSGVRLVISVNDAADVTAAAARKGLPFAILDDHDLEFTSDEVRLLMEDKGLHAVPATAMAVQQATRGHPGMVSAALEVLPQESTLGTLTRGQAQSAFLARIGRAGLGSGVTDFVARLVHVPRFTIAQAVLISQDERAAAHLHRLQRLGLGLMSYASQAQERMFAWQEPVRLGILRFLSEAGAAGTLDAAEVGHVAAQTHDHELQVVSLIAAGNLQGAEDHVGEWLWDLLPDGTQPVWRPLQDLALQALLPYPGLLCLWLRVAPRTRCDTAAGTAALAAAEGAARATRDPWLRLSAMARSMELARHSGSVERIKDVAIRVRDLVEGLPAIWEPAHATGAVSDMLVIAQAALQLGCTSYAAEFAQRALAVIATDRQHLDPRGTRNGFASRVILFSHRERGLEDPLDAELALSGWKGLSREADLVTCHLAIMWRHLDAGNLHEAEAHCRLAVDSVARPHEWLSLMFTHGIVLAVGGRASELEAFALRYERASQWRRDPGIVEDRQLGAWFDAVTHRVTGRRLPAPDFLPPPGAAQAFLDAAFAPRIVQAHLLLSAVESLRAGRPREARTALERAMPLLPSSGLAPLALLLATPEEVDQLSEVIKDHPAQADLRLDQARDFARIIPETPATRFSERELEILNHLRAGASNKTMAEAMYLSVNTVKFHRANLFRKLGVRNSQAALDAAARMGL